jgi:hypothetical protein
MTTPQTSVNISVINECSSLKDADVQAWIAAQQIQLDRDFFPIWNLTANLHFFDKNSGHQFPANHWALVLLDNSDQAGALGYHDLTQSGMPIAKVFAGDDIKYGLSWSVTASHEALEMLADPDINLTVFVPTQTGGDIFAYEVADAPEDDQFAYEINGIKVSDFVTPNWFNVYAPQGSKFDFCGHINQPFEILSGGYIGVFDISKPNQGWTQIQAQNTVPARTAMRMATHNTPIRKRMEKRMKGQANLVRSTAI